MSRTHKGFLYESRRKYREHNKKPSSIGEGNSNPLQYSCLEISTDRGAWRYSPRGQLELDWATDTYTQPFSMCYFSSQQVESLTLRLIYRESLPFTDTLVVAAFEYVCVYWFYWVTAIMWRLGAFFFPSVVHCSVYSAYKGVWHIRCSLKTFLEWKKERKKERKKECTSKAEIHRGR